VVLGAEGDQEERARAGHRVDQRLDERRAAAVDPVEILPQQQRRLAAATSLGDALHDDEEPSLPRLGSHAQRGIRGIGYTEEVEEQRQVIGQRLVEQQQGAGDLPPRRLVTLLLGDPEEVAHQLEDRQERDHLPMRDAVGAVDAHALGPRPFGELVTEAALPDPGLAHDADHPPLAVERPRHGGLDRRHLVGAADEAREPACARDIEPGARGASPFELVDVDRVAHALQRERPEIAQPEVAADERGGMLSQIRTPRFRELLRPLCQTHGVALRGVVHAEIVADLPDDHVARVEPHADGEVEAARAAQLVGVGAHALL